RHRSRRLSHPLPFGGRSGSHEHRRAARPDHLAHGRSPAGPLSRERDRRRSVRRFPSEDPFHYGGARYRPTPRPRADPSHPRRVTVQIDPNQADPNQWVTLLVQAQDDVGIRSLGLTVAGQEVTLDGRGQGRVRESSPNNYPVVARATDLAGLTTTLPPVNPL